MANFVSLNQIQIQIGLVLLVRPDALDHTSQPCHSQISFLTYVTCSRPNSFYTSMSETCSGFMSVQLIAPTLSSLSPAPSTIVMSASETISQTEVKYRKTWMLSTWSATLYNLMSQKGNGRVACTAHASGRGNMQPFHSISET